MSAGCETCGKAATIGGNDETVIMTAKGFRHGVCDDRWDNIACGRCGDTDRFIDGSDSVCSTCGLTR